MLVTSSPEPKPSLDPDRPDQPELGAAFGADAQGPQSPEPKPSERRFVGWAWALVLGILALALLTGWVHERRTGWITQRMLWGPAPAQLELPPERRWALMQERLAFLKLSPEQLERVHAIMRRNQAATREARLQERLLRQRWWSLVLQEADQASLSGGTLDEPEALAALRTQLHAQQAIIVQQRMLALRGLMQTLTPEQRQALQARRRSSALSSALNDASVAMLDTQGWLP